jgi:hypothetical protein
MSKPGRSLPLSVSGGFRPAPVLNKPSAFDAECRRLGLTEQDWASSRALTKWVRQNANSRFVPESLLSHLKITPTIN